MCATLLYTLYQCQKPRLSDLISSRVGVVHSELIYFTIMMVNSLFVLKLQSHCQYFPYQISASHEGIVELTQNSSYNGFWQTLLQLLALLDVRRLNFSFITQVNYSSVTQVTTIAFPSITKFRPSHSFNPNWFVCP